MTVKAATKVSERAIALETQRVAYTRLLQVVAILAVVVALVFAKAMSLATNDTVKAAALPSAVTERFVSDTRSRTG